MIEPVSYRPVVLRSVLVLAVALAMSGAPGAQPLEWERLGTIEQTTAIAFGADTLYANIFAAGVAGADAWRPQDDDFSPAFPNPNIGFGALLFLGPDTLLTRDIGLGATVFRTTDWFASTREVVGTAFSDPIELPSGTLLVGTRGDENGRGSLALRSTDRGRSWTPVGLENTAGIGVYGFVVMPPSPDRLANRIVASGFNGIAYSDDDAQTWTPSSIYGALGFAVAAAVRVAGTRRILALVQGNGQVGSVMASDDDGETWTTVGPSPGLSQFTSRLIAAPDGSVFLYEVRGDDDDRTGRPVWRTRDQGASWENVGPVWSEWSAVPQEITLGPDGRLYAATYGKSPSGVPQPILGGVFRTTSPVYAVADDATPTPPASVSVSVYPNPTGGPVTVEVALASAMDVKITVVDVQGRVVRELHRGRRSRLRGGASGGQRFTVETAGLAPGTYVVRVEGERQSVTASFTLAR